jgi:hypothetical protein
MIRSRELSEGLIALLETLEPFLDPKSQELVRDFVENNEFGVALEWLHSAVLGRKISLTAYQVQKFDELAALMGIDLCLAISGRNHGSVTWTPTKT